MLASISSVFSAQAAIVGFDRPGMDTWMYPNGFERGTRDTAPIFGGDIGLPGGDDRIAQYVVGWNTAASGIPSGLGPTSYAVTRVTFRATHVNDQVFAYDPTLDSFQTYLPGDDPDFSFDPDAGRPVELFGVGLRNGYTGFAFGGASATLFGESTTSFGVGSGPNTRHAFAISGSSPREDHDVSDNVSGHFAATPFAVGVNAALSPGQLVPENTEFTFQLNLTDASVLDYIRRALDAGELGLSLSALHPATFGGQPGAQVYPRFYTRESDFIPEFIPHLEIEYEIIPEPSPSLAILTGVALLASLRAWRRRDHYS